MKQGKEGKREESKESGKEKRELFVYHCNS
jgi:hypothetical protein